jgi:hypothetical protein
MRAKNLGASLALAPIPRIRPGRLDSGSSAYTVVHKVRHSAISGARQRSSHAAALGVAVTAVTATVDARGIPDYT